MSVKRCGAAICSEQRSPLTNASNVANRVNVRMAVTDKSSIDVILDLADDPAIYRFESIATIIE